MTKIFLPDGIIVVSLQSISKEITKRYTTSANRNVGNFYLCRRMSVTVRAVLAWACYVSRQKVIPTTSIR